MRRTEVARVHPSDARYFSSLILGASRDSTRGWCSVCAGGVPEGCREVCGVASALRSARREKLSAVDDGSALSLWSEDSYLSIASKGSLLSIGSVGSVLSVGSVGSAASALSVASAASIGSAMSATSFGSVMSAGKSGAILDEENARAGLLAAGILVAVGVTAAAAIWRAAR